MHYISETSRLWHERLTHHFLAINKNHRSGPLCHHFSRNNGLQSLKDVLLFVLEFLQTYRTTNTNRETVERKWQFCLCSNYPLGMDCDVYMLDDEKAKSQTH